MARTGLRAPGGPRGVRGHAGDYHPGPGTVQTVGSKTPIPHAKVTVEWPAALGGGQSELKSDQQGHFAVGRTRRVPQTACAGIAITVQAENYASAYTKHTEGCGNGTLSFDIPMLPQVR